MNSDDTPDTPAMTPAEQPATPAPPSTPMPRYTTVVIHLELTEDSVRELQAAQDAARDQALESEVDEAERIHGLDNALNNIALVTLAMEAAISAMESRQSDSDAIEDVAKAAAQMDPAAAAIVEEDAHGNRVSVHLTSLPYSPLRKG